MRIQARLKDLGLTLPGFNPPAANYAAAVRKGGFIFTAGQTPKREGQLVYKGKLGDAVTDAEGIEAVRLCTLNTLTILDQVAGGLDQISDIVKITVFLNCTPDYERHSVIADGATDLLAAVFGDAGRPARSAVGVNALPGGAVCEVEMVVALRASGED